ncbi:MAG TPA: TrkA family potassium uptake protein [Acidimicrobiales bacterium]|jgi:trk system potassium uptake protein TrkA|nr:TrkA family potassium uptake protein [Acidimicrobiales bacterium]
MKVAIAGAGKVGAYIANDLADAGHQVVVIERDQAVVAKLQEEQLRATFAVADACEIAELHRAGMADVDVMVAATGEDQVNLVVSLLAKQEFAIPRVVARVNHPDNDWLFNESWGVDVSVSTPHLLTALVEEAVSVGSLVQLLKLENGEAKLVEVTLAASCPNTGIPLAKLEIPRDATVVAVVRNGHVVVPRGDTTLEAGDEVLALVTPNSEARMKELLVGG